MEEQIKKEDLVFINPENIIFEFHTDNNDNIYVVFTKDDEMSDDSVYFAKKYEDENGVCILKEIEEEEYKDVLDRYEQILAEVELDYE